MPQKTFTTGIDLAPDVRARSIGLLNQHLADTFDLFSQIKQAHWNVKGMQFRALHELFDALAEEVEELTDMIAERAVALGGTAAGTVRMAASQSRLREYPADAVNGRQHVAALAGQFATLCRTTREAITTTTEYNDVTTADLFTEVSRGLDKNLWFLEAHLQDGSSN